jgi:hypothetical protein
VKTVYAFENGAFRVKSGYVASGNPRMADFRCDQCLADFEAMTTTGKDGQPLPVECIECGGEAAWFIRPGTRYAMHGDETISREEKAALILNGIAPVATRSELNHIRRMRPDLAITKDDLLASKQREPIKFTKEQHEANIEHVKKVRALRKSGNWRRPEASVDERAAVSTELSNIAK